MVTVSSFIQEFAAATEEAQRTQSIPFLQVDSQSISQMVAVWQRLQLLWGSTADSFQKLMARIETKSNKVSQLQSSTRKDQLIDEIKADVAKLKDEMELASEFAQKYSSLSNQYVTSILINFDSFVELNSEELEREKLRLEQSISNARDAIKEANF
jgi:hypothetical protein